ncbi:unnamed protein product [Fraxinus pennsylvanica]|uniref:Uncharacterized protein n=1 Tax=Fraxinus pennsylvanica TaxID=56036 RepID=A0AAD2DTF0_9LAMI|nr:unnamed protein product [Fraxinus pennsylvanica]
MEEEKKYKSEDQLKAVRFAAATAALMACFECATVVSRWRVWVFLSLNLLLLAILFTSSTSQSQSPSNETVQETEEKLVKIEREKKMQYEPLISASDEDHVVEKECNQLSKEELNQRVEAFITMFRQQYLLSDARSVKGCRTPPPSKGISVNSSYEIPI